MFLFLTETANPSRRLTLAHVAPDAANTKELFHFDLRGSTSKLPFLLAPYITLCYQLAIEGSVFGCVQSLLLLLDSQKIRRSVEAKNSFIFIQQNQQTTRCTFRQLPSRPSCALPPSAMWPKHSLRVEASASEFRPPVSREILEPPRLPQWKAAHRSSCRRDNKPDATFTEFWESAETPAPRRSRPPSEGKQSNTIQVRCGLCQRLPFTTMYSIHLCLHRELFVVGLEEKKSRE